MRDAARGARPRVLVLDECWDWTASFGAGLSDAGFEVHRAGPWLIQWPASGIFASQAQVDWADPSAPAQVDALVAALDPAVVFPVSEIAIHLLGAHAPDWAGRIFPALEPWQRTLISDKAAMSAHMASHGVAVPIARDVASAGEIESAIAELGLPLVVRRPQSIAGSGVAIASTAAEVRECVARFEALAPGTTQLQEYVDGATYLAAGLFQRGAPRRYYAAEKLDLWPARTGPSTRLLSDDSPALVEAGLRIFEALEWTGFANADFVRHPSRGFLFLEVNPRPWGSMQALGTAGVDLYGAAFDVMLGRPAAGDARFVPGRTSWLFPKEAGRRIEQHGLASLADPRSWRGLPWRQPRVAVETIRRLRQMCEGRPPGPA